MKQSRIQTLITQSRQGNTQAFATLVEEYQPLVFRLAFRLLCDEDEARDVVQDTFIKVWLSLHTYNSKFRFSTWIYKVATNAAYDKLRNLQHTATSFSTNEVATDFHFLSEEDIEKTLDNRELKQLIISLTAELPPSQKLVFTLRDLEELETEEVEIITGLSAARIKSNLYLARKFIRERINKLYM
ncbi:sigma-70 family RNA polymerase sigma factor [Bacteroides sp. OttesenSCG-928-E20]|nr:sigma-70 family RNA polymerase sigma factor [Bacteroides sp. OttesenSCG-928-N06]MDL2299312.1 sigma-70 family RNA polymerase sigma factor [Bacteroides sp. OttesenSCG-928-E20]